MPQGLADDLRFIQLLNSGELRELVMSGQKKIRNLQGGDAIVENLKFAESKNSGDQPGDANDGFNDLPIWM